MFFVALGAVADMCLYQFLSGFLTTPDCFFGHTCHLLGGVVFVYLVTHTH